MFDDLNTRGTAPVAPSGQVSLEVLANELFDKIATGSLTKGFLPGGFSRDTAWQPRYSHILQQLNDSKLIIPPVVRRELIYLVHAVCQELRTFSVTAASFLKDRDKSPTNLATFIDTELRRANPHYDRISLFKDTFSLTPPTLSFVFAVHEAVVNCPRYNGEYLARFQASRLPSRSVSIHPLRTEDDLSETPPRALSKKSLQTCRGILADIANEATKYRDRDMLRIIKDRFSSTGDISRRILTADLVYADGLALIEAGSLGSMVLCSGLLELADLNIGDARILLKKAILHETNHLLDGAKRRLPPTANADLIELSAIIRTAVYFAGEIVVGEGGFLVKYVFSGNRLRLEGTVNSAPKDVPPQAWRMGNPDTLPKLVDYLFREEPTWGLREHIIRGDYFGETLNMHLPSGDELRVRDLRWSHEGVKATLTPPYHDTLSPHNRGVLVMLNHAQLSGVTITRSNVRPTSI